MSEASIQAGPSGYTGSIEKTICIKELYDSDTVLDQYITPYRKKPLIYQIQKKEQRFRSSSEVINNNTIL